MLDKRPKVVLFDLDGTLVDSAPDLSWCIDETLKKMSIPPRGIEAVRHWVGNGVERLVKRALTEGLNDEPASEQYNTAIKLFQGFYAKNYCQYSQLYPGVLELLDFLKAESILTACVTNKAEVFTLPLLHAIGISDYFEIVVGGDTVAKKKPDPMPLLHVANCLDVDPTDCLMVGDSRHDIAAARAADFAIAAVPYGYNHGEDIRLFEPDVVVESLAELKALIAGLSK